MKFIGKKNDLKKYKFWYHTIYNHNIVKNEDAHRFYITQCVHKGYVCVNQKVDFSKGVWKKIF